MAKEQVMKDKKVVGQEQSPVVKKPKTGLESRKKVDFYKALRYLARGKKITKLEWGSANIYGYLKDARVLLNKADGEDYSWIISEGDLIGKDWVIL